MHRIAKFFPVVATATLALTFFGAAPASAVVETFNGTGNSGTDPLGMTWNTGNVFSTWDSWAMPGVLAGNTVFNPGNVSSGNGTYATSFTITFTGGVPLNSQGDIALAAQDLSFGTGFSELLNPGEPYNQAGGWEAQLVNPNTIVFTAPAGVRLNAGDGFDVFVEFAAGQHIDPNTFAFTATWGDGSAVAPAPEPASLALMGSGLFGLAMRKKRFAK